MLLHLLTIPPCRHFMGPTLWRLCLRVTIAALVCAEDIANPKHPLRFHQFISNMKRSNLLPPSAPQDAPKATPPTESQASPSDQQTQRSQNLSDPAEPRGRQGHDMYRHADVVWTARNPALASPDTSSASTSCEGHGILGPDSRSSATQQSMGTSTSAASGTELGLMNLVPYDMMSRTLSRGGPMPGGQVCTSPCLHDRRALIR